MKNSDTKNCEKYDKTCYEKKNQNNQNNKINQTHPLEASSVFVTDQSINDLYYEVFITTMTPSFAVFDYFLRSSWILNTGSKTHIGNKTMLHRFRKTQNVSSKTMLINETRSKIEIIEKIEIFINASEKKI